MIVTFEGFVYQGDEATKIYEGVGGVMRKYRTAVVTTNDENPGHISFFSRGEQVDNFPLTMGQKVRVTVDERDSKNDKVYWQTNRRLISVEYLN